MTSRSSLQLLPLLLLLAAASLAAPRPLAATSVVLGTDAELADQAPVVAEGTVIAREPAAFTSGLPTTDYRVRVLDGTKGTGAVVRVLIEMTDGEREWTTVGVSENIIQASYEALAEAYTYGLLIAGHTHAHR